MQETLDSWVGKFPWRRGRLPTPIFLGFLDGSDGKESACNVGHSDSTPGLGRFTEGGHENPLQYSCLENPHGQRSLASYSPWGHEELDMTERLNTAWASSVSQLVKNPPASAGHARDTGLIPVLERSPDERNGNPL